MMATDNEHRPEKAAPPESTPNRAPLSNDEYRAASAAVLAILRRRQNTAGQDLEAAANDIIVRAWGRFDPARGVKFSTYACEFAKRHSFSAPSGNVAIDDAPALSDSASPESTAELSEQLKRLADGELVTEICLGQVPLETLQGLLDQEEEFRALLEAAGVDRAWLDHVFQIVGNAYRHLLVKDLWPAHRAIANAARQRDLDPLLTGIVRTLEGAIFALQEGDREAAQAMASVVDKHFSNAWSFPMTRRQWVENMVDYVTTCGLYPREHIESVAEYLSREITKELPRVLESHSAAQLQRAIAAKLEKIARSEVIVKIPELGPFPEKKLTYQGEVLTRPRTYHSAVSEERERAKKVVQAALNAAGIPSAEYNRWFDQIRAEDSDRKRQYVENLISMAEGLDLVIEPDGITFSAAHNGHEAQSTRPEGVAAAGAASESAEDAGNVRGGAGNLP